MKRLLFSFALLVLAWAPQWARAQAPAWQSARAVAVATVALAPGTFSEVTATAVDAAGNVYLAGNFANTVVLGGTTLTSRGNRDIFVAKFNPVSNQFVWAQRAGGTSIDGVNTLVVSGSSVFVAGAYYSASADFGTVTLTNAGIVSGFVAKLTDAGSTSSFGWTLRVGGAVADYVNALAVSSTGVYVAGILGSSTVSFGATTLTSLGGYDAFVAKLTDAGSTGSFAWAQRAGGAGYDEATALAVSGPNVYVAGFFDGAAAAFGPATLTTAGGYDMFVAKLTDAGSTGSFGWAQRAGGPNDDKANALAVSGPSVYVAGAFDSPTAGFGSTTLTNAGNTNVFVAKLTDAGGTGSFGWAQRAGGTGRDYAKSLAVSGNAVLMAGYYSRSPSANFGSIVLANAGTSNVFVTKLSDAGSFVWAQRAGGTNNDIANALVVSGTSIYVAGFFDSPTAVYSTTTLTSPNISAFLGFLASLTDPTLTSTAAGRALAPASLFPNPARRTATLRLPAGTIPAPLTLTDALGRAVRQYPAPVGAEAALDLAGLPAGLYLLRGAGPAQRLAVE